MPTTARRIPITVLAGQSNANSTALAVEVFRATAADGGMMVHMAMNGSALGATVPTPSGHWNAASLGLAMGENLAQLFMQLTSILDPASPSHVPGAYLDNIIWIQGEADAYNPTAARDYAANLRAFHAALTARFGAHDLILSGLSDAPDNHHRFSGNHAQNWDMIQQDQRDVAASLATVSLIDPDTVAARAGMTADQMFRDDWIHYDDATGFAARLGRALVAAALSENTAATPNDATSRARIGTSGNDTFTLSLSSFSQVLAGPGHDRVTVASNAALTVIEATDASTRIITTYGPQPRILDLMRVESLQLGAGDDLVRLAGGVTQLRTGAGDDRVFGAARKELIFLGAGDDRARGGARDDIIYGRTGDDRLLGDAGDDWLRGGRGQDTVAGGDGRDRLFGGRGNDVLQGGAGGDTFVFNASAAQDRITDFNPNWDRIAFQDSRWRDVTLRQHGDDVIVSTATTRLIVEDTSLSDLHKSDILFL
jgi:Ca2+-binding RTX toxin-like protein